MAARRLYFEDAQIGDDIGPVQRVVTGSQVAEFVKVWRVQSEPSRFTDAEVARREGLPGPMVPGAMSVAILSQLVMGWSSTVTLKKIDVIFRQVVIHDLALTLKGAVTDKGMVDGEPQVECDLMIEGSEGAALVIGKATVALPTRE